MGFGRYRSVEIFEKEWLSRERGPTRLSDHPGDVWVQCGLAVAPRANIRRCARWVDNLARKDITFLKMIAASC